MNIKYDLVLYRFLKCWTITDCIYSPWLQAVGCCSILGTCKRLCNDKIKNDLKQNCRSNNWDEKVTKYLCCQWSIVDGETKIKKKIYC